MAWHITLGQKQFQIPQGTQALVVRPGQGKLDVQPHTGRAPADSLATLRLNQDGQPVLTGGAQALQHQLVVKDNGSTEVALPDKTRTLHPKTIITAQTPAGSVEIKLVGSAPENVKVNKITPDGKIEPARLESVCQRYTPTVTESLFTKTTDGKLSARADYQNRMARTIQALCLRTRLAELEERFDEITKLIDRAEDEAANTDISIGLGKLYLKILMEELKPIRDLIERLTGVDQLVNQAQTASFPLPSETSISAQEIELWHQSGDAIYSQVCQPTVANGITSYQATAYVDGQNYQAEIKINHKKRTINIIVSEIMFRHTKRESIKEVFRQTETLDTNQKYHLDIKRTTIHIESVLRRSFDPLTHLSAKNNDIVAVLIGFTELHERLGLPK